MQQRSDRFGFIGAIFHRDRAHAQNMSDVRNLGLLAQLPAMNPRRVNQRFFKLPR